MTSSPIQIEVPVPLMIPTNLGELRRTMEEANEMINKDTTKQFKVGDKVRINKRDSVYESRYDNHKGKEGIILSKHENNGGVYFKIMWDGGMEHTFYEKALILSKEQKRHVGKVLEYKPGSGIRAFVRELLKTDIDKERIRWLKTFENCILPKHVQEAVDEAITVVLMRDKLVEWGLTEHFEKGLTNSILIYGPPGTGKTMISESIAAVLGKNLMKITTSSIQSNVPGETERNIEKSFKKAKNENAVVLFDECDSILSNRDDVGTIMAAEINCFLTEIERFDGECILTTNRLHTLDPALQRRIIAKVKLDTPNQQARKQIWGKLIPKKLPLDKEVNFNDLAKDVLTGGEIKNSILIAARKAIAKNKDNVTHKNFEDAIDSILDAKEDYAKTRLKAVKGIKTLGSTKAEAKARNII